MGEVRPFTPDEVLTQKKFILPEFIIRAVNEFLAKRFDGHSCTVFQNEFIERAEAIGRMTNTLPDWASRQSFFDENWLDFEPAYREQGWKVYYDKPGYNENYEASWKFERAK